MKGWALAVGCALVVAARIASADATSQQADRIFDEGKRLFERGDFALACGRFEASLALQPGIGARLWLADCYENLGRNASAQRQFRLAEDEARNTSDKRESIAARRAEQLEPRVIKISVHIESPKDNQRVEVDGAPLKASDPESPIKIDPGRHLVTATAPGYVSWQLTFDADAPERVATVIVPELAPVVRASPQESAQGPTHSSPVPVMRTTGVIVAGAGAVGIAVGSVFAILAIRDHSRSKDGCDANFCTAEAHSQGVSALHEANTATAAFITGGTLLAAGAALFFFSPRFSVTVNAASRAVGLHGSF